MIVMTFGAVPVRYIGIFFILLLVSLSVRTGVRQSPGFRMFEGCDHQSRALSVRFLFRFPGRRIAC